MASRLPVQNATVELVLDGRETDREDVLLFGRQELGKDTIISTLEGGREGDKGWEGEGGDWGRGVEMRS